MAYKQLRRKPRWLNPVSQGKNVNNLPNEMLLEIFSYLTVRDICFSVSQVCQRWNALTRERALWRNVRFICNKDMTTASIMEILSKASNLISVELQWRTDTQAIIENLCKHCKEVRKLNMVCCGKITEDSIQLLVDQNPLLEVLSLMKCWAIQGNCYSLVYQFSHLRTVNLSHSKSLTGAMLKKIVDSCPLLVNINIDCIRGITDPDLIYLIEMRKHSLLSLILCGEILTDISFSHLEECSKLHTLHLSRCQLMADRGLQSISRLANLRSLKLRLGVNLSSEALASFLLTEAASKLEYLCLSRSQNLTDTAAMNIAANCKNLRCLDLLYCPNLTEQSQLSIINGCKLLKTFNFGDNTFHNDIIVIY